jgi:DNA-binding XRE family transcriptional regulator
MKPKTINPEQPRKAQKIYQPPKEIRPEHKDFMSSIGKKLNDLRNSKNLSSQGLAKQAGISRNAYHQMECGMVYFNFLKLIQVLDYHKISVSEFFKEIS